MPCSFSDLVARSDDAATEHGQEVVGAVSGDDVFDLDAVEPIVGLNRLAGKLLRSFSLPSTASNMNHLLMNCRLMKK